MMCPCAECLKLAICKTFDTVVCIDLYKYFAKRKGMWVHYNTNRLLQIQKIFKKQVYGTSYPTDVHFTNNSGRLPADSLCSVIKEFCR